MALTSLEKRLRLSGLLIVTGLVIQVLSLIGVHPLAFVAFLVFACPLIGVGVLLFLFAILRGERRPRRRAAEPPETAGSEG